MTITVHFNKIERKILTSYVVFRTRLNTLSAIRSRSPFDVPTANESARAAWQMLGSRSVRARLTVHETFARSMLRRIRGKQHRSYYSEVEQLDFHRITIYVFLFVFLPNVFTSNKVFSFHVKRGYAFS